MTYWQSRALVVWSGSAFQMDGAATEKARRAMLVPAMGTSVGAEDQKMTAVSVFV